MFALIWYGAAVGNCYGAQSGEQQSSRPDSGNTAPDREAGLLPLLSVSDQTTNPGLPAVVSLYVALPKGIQLQSISAEIEWKSTKLPFVSFQRGIAAEAVGADVTTKVIRQTKDETGGEISVLQVDISLADANPRRGIAEGLLAYLTFQVANDAEPTAIELRPKLVSAQAVGTPPQQFTQAEVASGKVFVEEAPDLPPYVNCFFFAH
ncbi:MAG: hypothetical protein HYX73_10670 [Acidobacteria bacterium]|nr:hypothetical protein [Acidobacteriota bacterium]